MLYSPYMSKLVSIVIINYNARQQLTACLDSLYAQTDKNLEIIFIDNHSQDGSCQYVMTNYPQVLAVCNRHNCGYAEGGNQGIKMAKGEYVMLLNPDVVLEKDYIGRCLRQMEEDSKIAAICGKIYKYDFEKNIKTRLIDTTGLFCYRNRRIIDNGQGLEDNGQFDRAKEVFGISGACPVYRKAALDDVKIGNEYLDQDFFMFKEDVDISWRFLLFGWKSFYLPSAVAYHGRGTGALKRFTHAEVLKNRSSLSKFQKYYSYKNQRLMQLKNELAGGFVHDFFPIMWKEILMFGLMIFREPYLFKALFKLLTQVPAILKKRRYIMKHRRVGWQEMKKWFSSKQSEYLFTGAKLSAPQNGP